MAIYGKATPQGAVAIFGAVQKTVAAAAAGPKRAEDVAQFMMFRRPGESYIETVKRMTEPGSEVQIYKNLKTKAGGNRETLIEMVMQTFGFSDYRQAEDYIMATDARLDLIAHPQPLAGAGAGGITTTATDEVLRKQGLKAQRKNLLEVLGFNAAGGGIIAGITEFFGGRVEDPVTKSNRLIWQAGIAKKARTGYGNSADAMVDAIQGQGNFMSMLPAEMQGLANYALAPTGGYAQTGLGRQSDVFTQMFPLFAMYGQYSKGITTGMSASEVAMMEKFSPMFKKATAGFGILGEELSTYQGFQDLTQAIYDANAENRDQMKDVTIVDILRAIEMLLQNGILTDTGTSETN
jgi:hypothetical protein